MLPGDAAGEELRGLLAAQLPPSTGGAGRPQLPGDGALSSSSGSAKPACRLATSLPPKLS